MSYWTAEVLAAIPQDVRSALHESDAAGIAAAISNQTFVVLAAPETRAAFVTNDENNPIRLEPVIAWFVISRIAHERWLVFGYPMTIGAEGVIEYTDGAEDLIGVLPPGESEIPQWMLDAARKYQLKETTPKKAVS